MKPANCSAAKAQALFQTMGMLSPDPSHGGGAWGREKGHTGQKNKAQDTYRKAFTFEQKPSHTHTHTHTNN